MINCLACLINPTWMCEACEEVGCCREHTKTFFLFQAKDPDEGMCICCTKCKNKVADSFRGKMYWTTSLEDFMSRPC